MGLKARSPIHIPLCCKDTQPEDEIPRKYRRQSETLNKALATQ